MKAEWVEDKYCGVHFLMHGPIQLGEIYPTVDANQYTVQTGFACPSSYEHFGTISEAKAALVDDLRRNAKGILDALREE